MWTKIKKDISGMTYSWKPEFLRRNGWFLFGALIVVVYFGYFVLPGLTSRFNVDDPMNIHNAWRWGGSALIKGLLLFFSPYYRPMGSLFFFSFYEIFGLNPFPYHVALILILLVNVILAYYCAKLLSRSTVVGGLCALLTAYHANMPQAVYLPAFIFDALCFMFFFAALAYYLRVRSSGNRPKKLQIVFFILLYIAALESKEMAVTLPLILLAYEFFWNPPPWSIKGLFGWIRAFLGPCLAAALITAVYLIGKSTGTESLSNNPMYQTTISGQYFLQSQVRFFRELFFIRPQQGFNPYLLVAVWLVLACAALLRRENYLKWATLFTIVAPLPIAFIPGRSGVCLCIPWFGWALWLSALAAGLTAWITSWAVLKRFPRSWVRAILLVVLVLAHWRYMDRHNRVLPKIYRVADGYFWSLKGELERVLPKVRPGAQIAYYRDEADMWDAKFATELFYHDRELNVWLCRFHRLSNEELGRMDYVLSLDKGKLTILKRPGEPFRAPAAGRNPQP